MLAVVTFLLKVDVSKAEVIFQTDFEDAADWSAVRPSPSGINFPNSWTLKSGGPSYLPPKKNDGSWLHPNSWCRVAPSILTANITPMATIGAGQGKDNSRGMIYNIEVSGVSGTWSGGSPLTMYLGESGYQELFVSMWVKYDSEFTWLPASPASGSQQKLVYISRLNEALTSTTAADNHSNGPLHPSWLPHWYNYISAQPFYTYYMNRSQQSNGSLVSYDQTVDMWSNSPAYYPGGGPFKWPESSPHASGVQSDGAWHHYEYRVVMNSAPGVADGIQEVWLDGVKKFSKPNMAFVLNSGSTATGWNYVELFDNANILSHPASENVTYPINIDNVVISTSYMGMQQADTTDPAAPNGLSVE